MGLDEKPNEAQLDRQPYHLTLLKRNKFKQLGQIIRLCIVAAISL